VTFDELIMSIEVEAEQNARRRARAVGEMKLILQNARNDGRPNLTDAETADIQAANRTVEKCDKDAVGINSKLEDAKRGREHERTTDTLLEVRAGDHQSAATRERALPRYDEVARVGAEERTYHKGNTGKGARFLKDVAAAFVHRNPEAEGRLYRHMQEERVERGRYMERAAGDAGTGAFAGLTVPQYLTDMYAPKARALRPFADACNIHDLPESGMTVNISQITTGSTTALQANELDTVSATSMDDTLLTENVQTASGQQSLSRQAIDRGTGIEDVTMNDLQRSLATTFDNTLITQATTGLAALAVGTGFTYVDTTPTGPELYPKILGAASQVEGTLLGFAIPDIAVMHSRRWYWLQGQMTTSWPMFGQPGIGAAWNAGENLAERYGAGVRGVLPNGIAVIVDNNVQTTLGAGTEDEIYVAASEECHLWIDPNAPQFIRAEQPRVQNLAVTLVLFMYFAYTFRRFASSIGKVSGTGLIAPTF
jgi:hypothetical protein